MKIAIDSLPQTGSIFNCSDYSGLQIHLLSNTPMAEAAGNFGFVKSNDAKSIKVTFEKLPFWNNGEIVSTEDYLRGFDFALSNNPFLKELLLRDLIKSSCQENSILFEFKNPQIFSEQILKAPCFSPIHNNLIGASSSGPWTFSSLNRNNSMNFVKNRYNNNDSLDRLQVQLIKDPEENLECFLRSQIDITADTAFPFFRTDEIKDLGLNPIENSVGLLGYFDFSDKLAQEDAQELRVFISKIIRQLDTNTLSRGYYMPTSFLINNENTQLNSKIENLTIAYDPYYPNKEICSALAHELERHNITVNLVEDSFERPFQNYDLKFCIMRSLAASHYTSLASLIFSKVIKFNKKLQHEMATLLIKAQRGSSESLNKMEEIYTQIVPIVPFIKIPSLHLNRFGTMNPLIRNLVCE